MKRLLLATFALVGTYGIANANRMTVHNLTGCFFTLSTTAGIDERIMPPGMMTFDASDFSSSFPPEGIRACKVKYYDGTFPEISIGVGFPPDFPVYANSATWPNTPPVLPPPPIIH